MRYGLLADVHANLAALEATLDALRQEEPDRFICAGDIVGYGPQPNECIEVLRDLGAVCVAGNHELIALGQLPDEGIHPWATETLRWTRKELSDDNRSWLEQLPIRTDTPDGITVAHGSLDDTRTYVRSEELAAEQLAKLTDTSVLVLGHTHSQFEVRHDAGLLVNPGAVGQTREPRIRAASATLDLESRAVRFLAVPYDSRATDRALAANGLPERTYRLTPSAARCAWLRLPEGLRNRVKRAIGR